MKYFHTITPISDERRERIGKMRLMPISMTLKNNCSHYIAKRHRWTSKRRIMSERNSNSTSILTITQSLTSKELMPWLTVTTPRKEYISYSISTPHTLICPWMPLQEDGWQPRSKTSSPLRKANFINLRKFQIDMDNQTTFKTIKPQPKWIYGQMVQIYTQPQKPYVRPYKEYLSNLWWMFNKSISTTPWAINFRNRNRERGSENL